MTTNRPRILLLDEATSALDTVSERKAKKWEVLLFLWGGGGRKLTKYHKKHPRIHIDAETFEISDIPGGFNRF